MKAAAVFQKGTLLACPTCERRITTALPGQQAICHAWQNGKAHRAAVMRPVPDVSARP